MQMTEESWKYISDYLQEVFGVQDDHLARIMDKAVEAGLPDIAVSADVGRLLMILTSMTQGRRAIEVGTLAGYSGIWIARGLKENGRLLTIEKEDAHADFAQMQFDLAGVGSRVDIVRGEALTIIPQLVEQIDAGSVDVVFLDAVKTEYPEYWRLLKPLIAVGGLVMADNVLGGGNWRIEEEGHPQRDAADKLNRLVADDSDFEAIAVPIRQGILIGKRVS